MKIIRSLLVLLLLYPTHSHGATSLKPITSDTIKVEMLNGKNGIYKTYIDFLKGNCIEFNFVKWIYHKHGSHLIEIKARFKDKSGRVTDYSCGDLCGFRSKDGFYRAFSYDNARAKNLFFFLR